MSEEFSLAGILRCIKSNLELSVIDQAKYGSLIVTTFSNLSEVLLKGFLINMQIKWIPNNLSLKDKQESIELIRASYVKKYFPDIVQDEIASLTFPSKDEFLQICERIKSLRNEYRNDYTHGFYSYSSDIPTETIRTTVERFLRFLEILSENWPELKQAITETRDLAVLTYYFSSERRRSQERWRKLNENIENQSRRIGSYLNEEFDGVRRLLALTQMGITSEDDFCRLIMGYDPELCTQIMPVLQSNKGLTCRQIQAKLRVNGNHIDLRKLENVLDDLFSIGKIKKHYENNQFVFRKF